MSQRIVAGLAAVPLLAVMWVLVVVVPLPYVTYSPGPTVNVLDNVDGKPAVEVTGHQVYRDTGDLRLTTIYVDNPEDRVGLLRLMAAWLNPDQAVYPRSSVYRPDATNESEDQMSEIQMVSSQDAAVAAALKALDYDLPPVVQVFNVEKDMPADGKLFYGDQVLSVAGTAITKPEQIAEVVRSAPAGTVQEWKVRRGDEELSVEIAAVDDDGTPRVGVTPGPSFDFPFQVNVDVGGGIGGPSAGLIFALAIYDTLTPGSLTDSRAIAGTGEINAAGEVGPIGGAQQKVAASRDADVELFLVPAANCASLGGVDPGDMRVAKVETLTGALDVIETWTDDPDADLPECNN